MKKFKFGLLLLICCAFIFSGCVGDKYLKTQGTNLSPATFYFNNYITSLAEFQNVPKDESVIALESDRITYANYMKSLYQVLPEERCAVSVLDYLCAVNQTDGSARLDTKTKTKIYEYATVFRTELEASDKTSFNSSNYANVKSVIVVKSAKNDLELSAYLYYMNKSTNAEVSYLLENTDMADYTFIFTQNKYSVQTKTYTLSYGKNGSKTGCTINATFNDSKGALILDTKTYLGASNVSTSIKKSIYKYSNGIVGIRAISNYVDGSKVLNVIYEQMNKDFYKKLKLGEIRDEQSILSMETMQENKLAKPNSSDNLGFEIEYNTQDDSKENKISCIKYGGTK